MTGTPAGSAFSRSSHNRSSPTEAALISTACAGKASIALSASSALVTGASSALSS